jgi:hypothetical protein
MRSVIRSILAVLAGLVVLTVVSFAIEAVADPLLMRLFPTALPDPTALARNIPARLIMLAYTLLAVAAGGYVTAWIAPRAKIRHAVIMGAIEIGLTLYLLFATAIPQAHQAPAWGFYVGMLLMVPAAALGGKIRVPVSLTPPGGGEAD